VDIKKVRAALGTMRDMGQAVNVGTLNKPLWRQYTPADLVSSTPATRQRAPDYTCPELQRNPGIPASRFAAFDLPSLVNGVRVAPKRPAAMCVGMLVDRSNSARG
jgi:hypothetical protein